MGGPDLAGSSSFDSSSNTLSVTAAGRDIWGGSDEFHFVSTPVTGDATIIAQVTDLDASHEWAKAGLMMRESLDDGSRHAHMLVSNGGGGYSFQHRSQTNNSSSSVKNKSIDGGAPAPGWIKLERVGNTFSGYASEDGQNWTFIGDVTLDNMPETVYVGMALTSHKNSETADAVFSDISLFQ
ncbi:MAG: DUF1349 domain-containing protein [Cyanobacteria bacterium P01_E01_bin.45]